MNKTFFIALIIYSFSQSALGLSLEKMKEILLEEKTAKMREKEKGFKEFSKKVALDRQDILYINYQDLIDEPRLLDLIITNYDRKQNKVFLNSTQITRAFHQNLIKKEEVPMGSVMKFLYKGGMINSLSRKFISGGASGEFYKLYGRHTNRKAGEEDILNFLTDILKMEVNVSNIDQINKEFEDTYGKGIDDFYSINEIFARAYRNGYLQKKMNESGVIESDIVSNSTARVRFYEDIDIDKPFNLTDKNIGEEINKFRVLRLFGHKKEDESGLKNKRFKKTINNYRNELSLIGDKVNQRSYLPAKIRKIYYANKREGLLSKINNMSESALLHGMAHYVEGSTMIVNRLAPIDYHNFHFPFNSGEILSKKEAAKHLAQNMNVSQISQEFKDSYMESINHILGQDDSDDPVFHIDGKYLSVSAMAITSKALLFNPLTENIRDIFFIKTKELGIIPFVVIGAAGVGLNVIKVKAHDKLRRGDLMGHFEFGASTVIMFIPEQYEKVRPYPIIEKIKNIFYTVPGQKYEREMEILISVGTPLFTIIK